MSEEKTYQAYKVRGNEGWEIIVATSFDQAAAIYKQEYSKMLKQSERSIQVWKVHEVGTILNDEDIELV